MDEPKTEQPPEQPHAPCEHEVLHRARLAMAELEGLVVGLAGACRNEGVMAFAHEALGHVGEGLELLAEFIDDYDAADSAMPPPKAN